MKPAWPAAIGLLVFAMLPGCCLSPMTPPSILNPGSEQYQQRRAEKFDPYPDPNIGPPVAGGRPGDTKTHRLKCCGCSREFLTPQGIQRLSA